jgi:hypothetical protein
MTFPHMIGYRKCRYSMPAPRKKGTPGLSPQLRNPDRSEAESKDLTIVAATP